MRNAHRKPLRDKLFLALAGLAIRHRLRVFVAVGLVTLLAVSALPFLKLRTTRQGMHPPDLPEQIRYERFLEDFGTATQLVILLEGDTDAVKAAADAVAAELGQNGDWVRNVFYRVDLAYFERIGPYFLPLDSLQTADAWLAGHEAELRGLLASPSAATALAQLAQLGGSAKIDFAQIEKQLAGLQQGLDGWKRFLTGEEENVALFGPESFEELLPPGSAEMLAAEGYLLGKDRRSALLFVQPAKTTDDCGFISPFMAYSRAATAAALKSHPGVTAGFTGWPVAVDEEVSMMKRDLLVVSLFSTLVILLLLYVSFRSLTKSALVFVPLVFGVLWNTALIYLLVGYLSYFTTVFIGLLFSLGTGYGIIFMRRFREELIEGYDTERAMERTFVGAGPGIATSAVTTIAAFVAISLFDVPAFSQMGIVSATGMLCLLVATMLILPPLMMVFREKIKSQAHIRVVGAGALEWAWRQVARAPLLFLLCGAAVIPAAIFLVPRVGFDYDVNHLLPADSETRVVAERLEQVMGQQTQFIAVTADNLEQVRRLQEKIAALPTVAKIESAASMLPPNLEEKRAALLRLHKRVAAWPAPQPPPTPDTEALAAQLRAFAAELAGHQEAAFAEGRGNLVTALGETSASLEAIAVALSAPGAADREHRFEMSLVAAFDDLRGRLATAATSEPLSLASLPEDLRLRFVGSSGRLALMVFPKEEIWDPDFLARFVDEVTGAAQEVLGKNEGEQNTAGFAVVYRQTSKLIWNGLRRALLLTLVFVALLLLIDFRRPMPALLAAVPFVVSMGATLSLLALAGRSLNMASQLALPVLIGIGVDFGVHTVHRWLEPDGVDLAKVVRTIGGAVWLAGATNMTGFGALLLARYVGLAHFGAILFVGIFLAFGGALLGIPAAIAALRLDRRSAK
ncbi:MAG: MMPL family transporter [Candidatus Lernaella stagnicola]|nr:MMPL family transporter [Candidatus Lernaella stagnicola]